jgi:thioredoxin-related protein
MKPETNSGRTAHPHFDDRGTLDWNTRFADAFARAREEQKLLFIELGREQCSQCRSLIEAIVPRPDVAPLLQQHFVALAADADDTEDEVIELAQKLEDAMMLPFVLFTDSAGQFLEGSSGLVNPRDFAATLRRLTGA